MRVRKLAQARYGSRAFTYPGSGVPASLAAVGPCWRWKLPRYRHASYADQFSLPEKPPPVRSEDDEFRDPPDIRFPNQWERGRTGLDFDLSRLVLGRATSCHAFRPFSAYEISPRNFWHLPSAHAPQALSTFLPMISVHAGTELVTSPALESCL